MSSGQGITLVIKARNEAGQILDCIESARCLADEIILVDDASDDHTVQLAEQAGARAISARSRDGMVDELDRIGFEAASGEWILRLDADERLTPSLAAKLRELAVTGQYDGISFARKNIMFGRWVRHGGWFKNDQTRFFRSSAWDRGWTCEPHLQPEIKGKVLRLPLREEYATIHYDYDSIAEFIQRTLLGYARTEALLAFRKNRQPSALRIVGKPLKRFLGRYFLRQGFRDGWRGFILAALLAGYDLCIESFLWDFHRREGR
ncbi:MAG: glycosyltransferase family 2 protein [Planctomycetes bacterium]|nr:glycosyltransferase family 2 protein [Planctomycetota bacterium]